VLARDSSRSRCRPRAVFIAAGVLGAGVALAASPVRSAELDGVRLPDTVAVAGTKLKLNGIGLRTYSVFRIHIYVAGLYLEGPSQDAEAILNSDGTKLLQIHFVHDVGVRSAQAAWEEGFERNCVAPCHLPPQEVARFLSAIPEFHRGDDSTLLFSGHSVAITVNGRAMGTVTDATFARAILATFIGVAPPTEPLKRGLLGGQQ
jgi:hypothetical protein